jgi:Mn2+/Fe2+ NRAMP family transporter
VNDSPGSPIQAPPRTLWAILRSIGPGLIISANIVGTGELIMTTKLGAEVGFTLLWFILFSCFIKVFVQVELGRYALSEGVGSLEALDRLPGPRFRVSWIVWLWMGMYIGTLFQNGGMIVGIADLMEGFKTGLDHSVWAVLTAASLALILGLGRYRMVEWGSTLMVAAFTLTTVVAVGALQWTRFRIGPGDLARGLAFGLPADVTTAFGAFAITGVGASELVFYPIWLLEKGYARKVGPRDGTPEWTERARGWLRVMKVDAWVSMAIYTLATVSFYLLGAAVLHAQGLKVTDQTLVGTLSQMYRQTFGEWSVWLFLVGAFMVLYSTVFVSTASHSRLFADVSALLGIFSFRTPEDRQRIIRYGVIGIPALLLGLAFAWKKAVSLVIVGALAQGVMLPFLGLAALYFRHRRTSPDLRPGRAWTVFLWVSVAAMTAVGAYSAGKTLRLWT